MSGLIDPKKAVEDGKRLGLIDEAANYYARIVTSDQPSGFTVKLPSEAGIAAIPIAPKVDRRSLPKPPKAAAIRRRYVLTPAEARRLGYKLP